MAIPLKNKSGLSITIGFKIVLSENPQGDSESRKPERLWEDRGSAFHNKTFKSLLKEYEKELYSTYSDLKAVFIERLNRTLLHIINKPMFINGEGYCVDNLNDAVVTFNNNKCTTINMTPVDASNNLDKVRYYVISTKIKPKLKVGDYVRNADKYNKNIHFTINMTPVDASNNLDKVRYYVKSTKATTKFKVGDYVRNADKRNIFAKGYTSNWNRELFKVNEVLKTQPPTYKREDIKGEIIEGKYYEQELLKSEFDFDSNNKVLESINIVLNINNDKKQIQ